MTSTPQYDWKTNTLALRGWVADRPQARRGRPAERHPSTWIQSRGVRVCDHTQRWADLNILQRLTLEVSGSTQYSQSQTQIPTAGVPVKIGIEIDVHVGSQAFAASRQAWLLFLGVLQSFEFLWCSLRHGLHSFKAVDQMLMFLRCERQALKQKVNATLDWNMVGIGHENMQIEWDWQFVTPLIQNWTAPWESNWRIRYAALPVNAAECPRREYKRWYSIFQGFWH
jgi:hypothetical protein